LPARRFLPTRALTTLLALTLALGGALHVAAPAAAAETAPRPSDGVFSFDGRGFGHGRGMSQHGAQGAARAGLNHAQILSFYYANTVLGSAQGSVRRVLITAAGSTLEAVNGPGLHLRDTASGAVVNAGAQGSWTRVRVRWDGATLRTERLAGGVWAAISAPGWPGGGVGGPVVLQGRATTQIAHPAGARTYRGSLVASRSGSGAKPMYVVNHVGLDDYVRGVVPYEMPTSWHPQALRAQAVAARSYGMQPCPQSAFPSKHLYDVVDTTSCQVYAGVGGEAASSNQAVADTAGQVLRYHGNILRTEFSSANGGETVHAGGAFVARTDPYDGPGASSVNSTVHRWTGVRVAASRLESAFGTGTLREIQVLQRDGRGEWGGRVLRVRLVGSARTVEVTGEQVRIAGGLRSSWWTLGGHGAAATPVSAIEAKHRALGGNGSVLGAPATAERPTADVVGRFVRYQGGVIYWHPRTGAFEVHGAILDTWNRLGAERGPLGYPTSDEWRAPDGTGRMSHFQHGSIYWSPSTGAREVRGAIRSTWSSLGWERGPLGYPTTDELPTPSGTGRYNDFQNGSILWSPATGAREVRGEIHRVWADLGADRSALGLPVTNELGTPDGRGRFNHFQAGSIYWTHATGANEVRGAIRSTWSALGWERSALGYPTTDERPTSDGRGRYNDFQAGSVYWSPTTGAREVRGMIRDRWVSLGAERSALGFPTSNEYAVPGGRANDFSGGRITWNAATGATTVGPR
jgi:stage II sporulation protein D